MKRFSDKEIIDEIKKGNKDVLVFLYDCNYRTAKDFVIKHGGNDQDIDIIFKDALMRIWDEIRQDQLPAVPLSERIMDLLNEAWVGGEIKRYITRNSSLKPFYIRKFKRKTIGLAILVFITLSIPVVWWYLENFQPAEIRYIKSSRMADSKNEAVNVENHAKAREEFGVQKTDSETSVQDQVTDTLKNSEIEEALLNSETEINEEAVSSGEDDNIVIKKDRLIFIKVINVIDKSLSGETKEKNSTRELLEKLNPYGKLPQEPELPRNFMVEFWQSPVNYKGFKLTRNKVILFGIEEPELVRLINIDENLYFEYGEQFYLLDFSYDFKSFIKVKDPMLLAQLTK